MLARGPIRCTLMCWPLKPGHNQPPRCVALLTCIVAYPFMGTVADEWARADDGCRMCSGASAQTAAGMAYPPGARVHDAGSGIQGVTSNIIFVHPMVVNATDGACMCATQDAPSDCRPKSMTCLTDGRRPSLFNAQRRCRDGVQRHAQRFAAACTHSVC